MSLIPVTGEPCLLNSPSLNTTRHATKVAKLVSVGALPVVVHKASLTHSSCAWFMQDWFNVTRVCCAGLSLYLACLFVPTLNLMLGAANLPKHWYCSLLPHCASQISFNSQSLYHYITTLLYHHITTSPYHYITTSPYHYECLYFVV